MGSEPAEADPPTQAAEGETTADPADPAEPTEVADPTDPTDPADPTEVADLAEPADLADLAEATDAAEVTGLAEPTGAEPADADPPTEALDESPDERAEELPELSEGELEKALEALLLVVDSPVEEDVLAAALGTSVERVTESLLRVAGQLAADERGFDLRRAGGGWRYYTRDKYAPYVEKMLLDGQRAKLTRAALETLAVIAYRQPVTRARVAAVRGVNCDGVIRTLLARGLVEETGTDLETGGFLYRTTELFLERLGLSTLDDLPPIAPLLPEVDSIDDI
ncbi:SMC-Scp complex subunit ScpB [Actinophytocola sp.]|uniref:SMC-Scp complex subunit ScpB n=1 Tax=Actinophytocola sp. TaxID=1872138 RepID=UPI002EDA0FF9